MTVQNITVISINAHKVRIVFRPFWSTGLIKRKTKTKNQTNRKAGNIPNLRSGVLFPCSKKPERLITCSDRDVTLIWRTAVKTSQMLDDKKENPLIWYALAYNWSALKSLKY